MDVKRMYCMIEKLAECAEKQFDAGIENIDTAEMGQVVDMMKDLAEAMYYRELTKAMQEFDTEDVMEMLDRYGDGRKFYDHYRYADGRFAPKGRGTYRRGYEEPPYYHMTPEMVHPHAFRHRFAKSFIEKCGDISLLSDLLGHKNLETTRIYLRRSSSEQYEIVNRVVTW